MLTSMDRDGTYSIGQTKAFLAARGIPVRVVAGGAAAGAEGCPAAG